MPWRTLGSWSGSARSISPEWEWRSMNPGATTLPVASIVRVAGSSVPASPVRSSRPSRISTAPGRPGVPVPSTIVPLTIRMSGPLTSPLLPASGVGSTAGRGHSERAIGAPRRAMAAGAYASWATGAASFLGRPLDRLGGPSAANSAGQLRRRSSRRGRPSPASTLATLGDACRTMSRRSRLVRSLQTSLLVERWLIQRSRVIAR